MNRRECIASVATLAGGSCAGCVSRRDIPLVRDPATVAREADRAGTLTGYDELDCEVSQEESQATPVSPMEFGAGDGEHWVYLLLESRTLIAVDIRVVVNREQIYERTVELGRDRYVSFEFKYEAPYELLVDVDGKSWQLEVDENRVNPPPTDGGSVTGQTYCLTVNEYELQEQTWSG